MKIQNLDAHNRPLLTQKYSRKIRLLLTNMCNRNCVFCHNEGMPKNGQYTIDFDKIKVFFGEFPKVSNRIVLTGGEPLLYPQIERMIYELSEFGLDITIDTAISNLQKYYSLLTYVSDIHISFLDYEKCDDFIENIESLFRNVPSIRVAINVPLSDEDIIETFLPKFRDLSQAYGVRLQLIKIFDPEKKSHANWNQRWEKMLRLFHYQNLYLVNATERETSFVTQDYNLVDFIDIPCEFAGQEFSRRSCLNEMDITITPDMAVQFCRWSPKTDYPLSDKDHFIEDVTTAFQLSVQQCKCGRLKNDFLSAGLAKYNVERHYTWPPRENSFIWKINQQISCSHTSYFGKEGYIRMFENAFAKYIGVSYALTLCSGAAAFYIACQALGVTSGSKVILPVYSYPGLMTALIQLKADVVLCDVESDTGNISLESFKELANSDIAAVVITHLWGNAVDISKFQDICKEKNIAIIEDASHAFGARINNMSVGSIGDIAFFSLQSNKVVYAGEGGVITTNNRTLYEKAIMYSMLKKRVLDCVVDKNMIIDDESGWGLKLKLNPLGAVMACYSLEKVSETNYLRQKNHDIFTRIISNHPMFTTVETTENCERVFYTFKIILAKEYLVFRDYLVDRLIRRGLDVTVSSFRPLHTLNITRTYMNENLTIKTYPNADFYSKRVMSFPAFTYEDNKLVEFYAYTIIEEANCLMEEIN